LRPGNGSSCAESGYPFLVPDCLIDAGDFLSFRACAELVLIPGLVLMPSGRAWVREPKFSRRWLADWRWLDPRLVAERRHYPLTQQPESTASLW